MRAVLAGLMLAGCASATSPDNTTVTIGGKVDAGGIHHIDAPDGENPEAGLPVPDAFVPMIDAAPGMMTVTVSGTNSTTVAEGTGLACPADSVGTSAQTYYRVFDLSKFGITSDFHISSVQFGVEDCESVNSNGAVVAVRVGTYSGTTGGTTLQPATITILASNNTVQVPELDMTPGSVTAPITATIPAGQKLIVEVDAPEGNNQYQLYMGANTQGQTLPSYVSATRCNLNVPTDPSTLGTPPSPVDMIITATGTFQP